MSEQIKLTSESIDSYHSAYFSKDIELDEIVSDLDSKDLLIAYLNGNSFDELFEDLSNIIIGGEEKLIEEFKEWIEAKDDDV